MDHPDIPNSTSLHLVEPWAEPKLPQGLQSPAPHPRLLPQSPEQAMVQLSRCLTLCSPSGMSMDDRTEWLSVAYEDVKDIPAEVFDAACKEARKTCDHPAKIVPAILAYAEPHSRELRSTVARPQRPRLVYTELPEPEPAKPLTQADCDRMPEYLVSLGLTAGFLIRNADGTVSPAPESAA